jgi:hypothetical protein
MFLSLIGLIITFSEIEVRSITLGLKGRLRLLGAMIGIILFLDVKILLVHQTM